MPCASEFREVSACFAGEWFSAPWRKTRQSTFGSRTASPFIFYQPAARSTENEVSRGIVRRRDTARLDTRSYRAGKGSVLRRMVDLRSSAFHRRLASLAL